MPYTIHNRLAKESYSWDWQCVASRTRIEALYGEPIWARDPLDAQLHLALLIRSRTPFKCHISFRSITTSCQMPPSILFTIYLFFNAWCLIIWLSEHRIFTCRLVLNDHSSVTDEHWHLIISQFAENLWYYNMPPFCSDPYILFEDLTCAKIKSENFCPRVYKSLALWLTCSGINREHLLIISNDNFLLLKLRYGWVI